MRFCAKRGAIVKTRLRQASVHAGGLVVTAVIFALGIAHPGQAAEFSCVSGDVACPIAAIHTANANGQVNTISLEAGTYTLTVVDHTTDGANGLPSVASTLMITGAGADTTIVERAASAPPFRLIHVATTGTLVLEGLTLRRVALGPNGGSGGGILNRGTLTNSILSDNAASGDSVDGGGVHNDGGTLTIANSTLSGNTVFAGSDNSGGGLYNAGGTVTITNSTFSDNTASGRFSSGGGLSNAGTLTLQNTILALNIITGPPGNQASDCSGPVTSLGNNLIGTTTGCTITLLLSDLKRSDRGSRFGGFHG
jgi:hypothetical protein